MAILTTHQPIFLPWPGLFYKAFCADTIVLLDRVQFPLGRGWVNRNRLKGDQGDLWLTVPVWKKGKGKQQIRDVEICNKTNWRRKHLCGIRQHYANAPYLEAYVSPLTSIYMRDHHHLIDLNYDLIRFLWDALGLKRRLVLQSDLDVSGKGTDLLVSICSALHAETYVTFPIVSKYLEAEKFSSNGIRLVFAAFSPPVYPQLWGAFRYNLSTLDLLLNYGPKSLSIITHHRSDGDSGAT
ncbi:MAG: WbqC family protein [Nitrospiria bacterium]